MWRIKFMVFLSLMRSVMQPMWFTQVEKPGVELRRDGQSVDGQELVIHGSISPGQPSLWGSPEDGAARVINRVIEDPNFEPERAMVWPVHELDLEDGVLLLEDVPGSKEDVPGSKEDVPDSEEEFPVMEESPSTWLFHIISSIFTLIDFCTFIYWMNLLRKRLIRRWGSNRKRGNKRRKRRRRKNMKR